MKKICILKLYGLIGKILLGIAGLIIGFVKGGLYFTIPGLLAGLICGHFLWKYIVTAPLIK